MRILVVPMSAMAETSGPSSRCRLLVEGFREEGALVATCMAEDVNYKRIDGVKNYFLDIPMPFGLPKVIATRTFPIAQKLGITAKKTVKSFDQVLQMTGNLDSRYLRKSIDSVRKAIADFKPDIVYSEFNISAIIAARKERVPLFITVSKPTQHEYANNPRLADGLNTVLRELDLPQVVSALQLFDWGDMSFCSGIRELEPINKTGIRYFGTLKKIGIKEVKRDKILVYMGNGTVSASKTLNVIGGAFKESGYEVYIASSYLKEETRGNIHIAPRWDFNKLLDEAVLFINHGGQNSMVDGLLHGVPQILVPGKVFERKYNAKSIEDNGAGKVVAFSDFKPEFIRSTAEKIITSREMSQKAALLGRKLAEAGGMAVIINEFGTL